MGGNNPEAGWQPPAGKEEVLVKLSITIRTDGAAFDGPNLFSEVRDVLEAIRKDLPHPTESEQFYRDSNGNTCAGAKWEND